MNKRSEKTNLNKNEPQINRGFELMLRYLNREEVKVTPIESEPESKPKKWWRIW